VAALGAQDLPAAGEGYRGRMPSAGYALVAALVAYGDPLVAQGPGGEEHFQNKRPVTALERWLVAIGGFGFK
jgi:hypothetical protein